MSNEETEEIIGEYHKIELADYELKALLLELFDELIRFLDDNNIRYFICDGTLLGSYRHKGFIPWDDDIDIGILRDDYNRLLDVSEKVPEGYRIDAPGLTSADKHPYPYAKFVNENYLIIEDDLSHTEASSGIYIDIFPFDNCPTSKIEFLRYKSSVFKWAVLRAAYLKNPDLTRKRVSRHIIKIVRSRYTIDEIISTMNYRMKAYYNDNTGCVANLSEMYLSLNAKYYSMDTILPVRLMPFEGRNCYGVNNPVEYLSTYYGDFMSLPPAEERVAHHHFSVYAKK